MTVTYRPSYSGIGKMLNAPFMVGAMNLVGHAIARRAEDIAPVGPSTDPHAGRYKASFHVRSHAHGGAKRDRAEAIVWNDSPEAMYVEWGSAGREPYHTLLTAASEGGLLWSA